ncbi:MAG TPA: phytanoyl-CoA dioxygenase family protein [Caulobacteraceae bacterium]|jgi:hypothetical protein|nr:phytanoyl-CoA dioxygenase family protein [Caulobacteraceae bacterium]
MTTLQAILDRQPRADFDVGFGETDIAGFEERGFIQVERVTTEAELDWLRELYDYLFSHKLATIPGGYFDLVREYDADGEDLLPQILAPEQQFPQLRTTAFWRNGQRLAAQLLRQKREDMKGWGHMIRKPARIGEALPWHQDEAYWDPTMSYLAVGCWMPLDPATVESGCMSFVPGSHRGAILPHKHVGDDPNVHGLYAVPDPADVARAVAAPCPPGGAVMHHPRMLHCSGPNVSDHVRRAYANEWQLTPVKREVADVRPWHTEGKQAFAQRRQFEKSGS